MEELKTADTIEKHDLQRFLMSKKSPTNIKGHVFLIFAGCYHPTIIISIFLQVTVGVYCVQSTITAHLNERLIRTRGLVSLM